MSGPDNSYSIRMRRLRQKQDALFARNTVGSQLMQPFNYNISPTGSFGNQFMLGTFAGSKNEVNTSPYGRVINDIACTCTATVEAAEAGPTQTLGPNITLMIPGSVFGFAPYDSTRSCVFKVDTSGTTPTIAYQKVYTTLATNFEAYLMEKGSTSLYIAGYSGSAGNDTIYLLVIDPADGTLLKTFTYTNKSILGISEIGTNLYITSVAVDLSNPSITSYVDIYTTTNFNTSPTIRIFPNVVLRGKILNPYSIVFCAIAYELGSLSSLPTVPYDIKAYIWTGDTLNTISSNISLITNCTGDINLFTDLTILINSPTTINISSKDYLVFADCVVSILSIEGLNFFGYNITDNAIITPVRLDAEPTPLYTPYVTTLVRGVNYFYVAAGENTNRIYGININGTPFTTAITPSGTTQYSAANNRFTTDNTSLFRFEFDGTTYTLARYVADDDLSGSPDTTFTLDIYNQGVFGNVVYDPINSGSIYLNTANASVNQLNSTSLTDIGGVSLDILTI